MSLESQEIIYSEQYGAAGRRNLFVKPTGVDDTRLSVTSSTSYTESCMESITQFFREVFLPQGYPDSVSDDYYWYQLWDTVQASCSTITGTLTTQAIMKGVGVGDTAATPFAAAVTWILKDGTGMAGRIIFAWIQGTSLDGDCKKWRLFADAVNDMAMALELLLPAFMEYSMYILCISTAMKSVVGVAGGATRAAITQHQAIRNNMADVSAKDGSQETFVNLCASVIGIIILATFDEGEFVWQLFTFFTFIHLFANYKAVKSLKMVTLNKARLNLLLLLFLGTESVSSPESVNNHESVIVGTGLSDKDLCGFQIILGASFEKILESGRLSSEDMKLLTNFYRKRNYLLVMDTRSRKIYVFFSPDEETKDVIQGYFHAVTLGVAKFMSWEKELAALNKIKSRATLTQCPIYRIQSAVIRMSSARRNSDTRTCMDAMMAADEIVNRHFPAFLEAIQKEGWSIENHHITIDEWRGDWRSSKVSDTGDSLDDSRSLQSFISSMSSSTVPSKAE